MAKYKAKRDEENTTAEAWNTYNNEVQTLSQLVNSTNNKISQTLNLLTTLTARLPASKNYSI